MIPRLRPFFGWDDMWAVLGSKPSSLDQFERRFASQFQAKHALFLPYGRSALYFYLQALNLKNKEVILSAYNCRAVAATVIASGNVPVYVDSEEDGYNIDLSQVKSYITNKTAALVITAMYGYPINTSLLNNIRQSYPDLVIIGDNCLSLFTSIPDPDYANQFDFSFYSFGLGKQMSTIEGGMLLTNRDDLFELVQSMQSKLGFKASFRTKFMRIAALISASIMFSTPFYKILYFLSEKTTVLQSIKGSHVAVTELLPDDVLTSPANFQAALGLSQLTKKDENSRRRLKIVETYFHSFRGHEQQRFELPPYYPYLSHFPILVDKRDALQRHLLAQGIHTTNVFREMPSDLPLLQEYCHGSYSRAQFITDHCLLLPLFPHLSKRHLYRVIHAVLEWDGS